MSRFIKIAPCIRNCSHNMMTPIRDFYVDQNGKERMPIVHMKCPLCNVTLDIDKYEVWAEVCAIEKERSMHSLSVNENPVV